MSIEEVIKGLETIRIESEVGGWYNDSEVLNQAIAMLKTHPDNQPNEPLTFEDMSSMCVTGGPVWVEFSDEIPSTWGVVNGMVIYLPAGEYCTIRREGFGEYWSAYRRPPKEET